MNSSLSIDLLQQCGIPRKFWRLGSETFPGSYSALKQARKYARLFSKAWSPSSGIGLLFQGEHETGKTFLLTLVLKLLLLQGVEVLYFTLEDLTSLRVSSHSRFLSLIGNTTHCLGIDNIGELGNASLATFTLKKILRFRGDNSLPCVLTTSLEGDTFLSTYGQECSSCIKQNFIVVTCSKTAADSRLEEAIWERKQQFLIKN